MKTLVIAAALTLAGGAAYAHHSFAMFDNQKELVLSGAIKEFQWTNPHTWVQIVVKDASGKDVEWSVEGGSPNGLSRTGWTRTSMKPGDKAEIVIHPLKDGSPGGSLIRASINGKPVGAGGAG